MDNREPDVEPLLFVGGPIDGETRIIGKNSQHYEFAVARGQEYHRVCYQRKTFALARDPVFVEAMVWDQLSDREVDREAERVMSWSVDDG